MKVLIADDHQLFRIGLRSVLKKNNTVTRIEEAENGREVIDKMKAERSDVILMDINMPVMDGMEATRVVKRDFPTVKVIALSMYEDQKHVIQMLEFGASGYIVKNTSDDEINLALLKVMNHELYFSNKISEIFIRSIANKYSAKKQPCSEISPREKEILYLICREYTSKEIAATLFLSEKTIDWHRLNLLQKTNSKNIAGLVLFALKSGVIDANLEKLEAI